MDIEEFWMEGDPTTPMEKGKIGGEIECLTLDEVAQCLRMSKGHVILLVKAGKLPGFQINGWQWRFPVKDLRELIDKRMKQAQTKQGRFSDTKGE